MKKVDVLRNAFKYLCFSVMGWDDPNKKVEDKIENAIYFLNEKYKEDTMKEVNKYRKSVTKTRFFENKETSTTFNVYEFEDEVIFSFRGSDSAIDWIRDFTFFKTNFDKIKSSESLNNINDVENNDSICFNEYVKSCEGVVDKLAMTFRNSKLVNSFRNYNIPKESIIDLKEEEKNVLANLDIIKNKIYLHSGFVIQFNSVLPEIKKLLNEYDKNKNIKKITFVGHSLGSSIARLATVFAFINKPKIYEKISCYAYGTPKLGNKIFEDYIKNSFNMYDKKIFIINSDNDFVKELPPNGSGFFKPKDDIYLKYSGKTFFNTKFDHTLFYYLYLYKNGEIIYNM